MSTETRFKNEAKMIVDSMFESGTFHEKITRDDMNEVENFISFSMTSRYNSEMKAKALLDKIEKSKQL